MNMVLHALRIGLLPALLLLTTQTGHAGSATWLATPATGDAARGTGDAGLPSVWFS